LDLPAGFHAIGCRFQDCFNLADFAVFCFKDLGDVEREEIVILDGRPTGRSSRTIEIFCSAATLNPGT
jgi:hypothetical protein